MTGMVWAAAASLLLAAVMTAGDFAWAYFGIRHTVTSGVIHGAAMCLCIGAVIGARAGRLATGVLAGPLIGALAAAAFYALAPAFRWGAMLPAWMLFWICFALLQGRLRHETSGRSLARGLAAAVASGLAFYSIAWIWTRPSRGGPDYLVHFVSWAFAFLPGFLALFLERARPRGTVESL